MPTTYYGIFNDGQIIQKHTLEEAFDVLEVEHVLKCVITEDWPRTPTFTIMNREGSRERFKVGDFEVIDIGQEAAGYGSDKVIKLKEHKSGRVVSFNTKKPGIAFFKDELLPLLFQLNECGSLFMYEKLQELERLKEENADLKVKIKELQERS